MAQASRVFRVFVSSTFTDLEAERDALQTLVFPKLREHCAESGYSFQAIDLRWGIGVEASAGQRTMRICLDELARCQAVTPRPNFLVLLGDRYGWRPLPEEVPAAEFEAVRAKLEPDAQALAGTWYRLDENAVPDEHKPPGVYRLQPRGADEETAWNHAQRVLAPALRKAALAAGLADSDAFVKYTASATEQEILAGALAEDVDATSVFAFYRTIDGLPEGSEAKDYRDLGSDGTPDTEAGSMLAGLKERLRDRLGADNVETYQATWQGTAPFTDHLAQLCDDVRVALTSVIDAEIARLPKIDSPERERAAHEAFRDERASSFEGREEYLAAIGSYAAQGAAHPLVVWGTGGSGKSALLAQAIADARTAHSGATLVHRFIGATPASADIRSLLQDLFAEIGTEYGIEGETPSDFNELVRAFRERLEAAGAQRPLLLFLDSLDQLSASSGAQGLSWLPTQLPEGVWLVVSTRPDEDDEASSAEAAESTTPRPMRGQLGTLQRTLPETAILELRPMTLSEGERLLAAWLKLAKRTLTAGQRSAVLDSFARSVPLRLQEGQHGGLPLHLRLAFETSRTWCSYDPPAGIRDKVRDMVAALYERLEHEHGPVLVGHTLAFLAVTRNTMGLAEDEILDVLPADNAVLDEFRSRSKHEVVVGRIPVIVWSRLYFDLQPYLGTRSSEGATLLAFYHRELAEVATKRYLEGHRAERHATLAGVFRTLADPEGDGTWTGRSRALAELPYHLAGADNRDGVFEVLTDFSFLEQKAARVGVVERPGSAEGTLYTGVYALLDDYDNALPVFREE